MTSLVMLLVSMSLQAVLIIGVVFGIRRLFALAHISKKYVMLLWMIPFFFLIFPWKIAVPIYGKIRQLYICMGKFKRGYL